MYQIQDNLNYHANITRFESVQKKKMNAYLIYPKQFNSSRIKQKQKNGRCMY